MKKQLRTHYKSVRNSIPAENKSISDRNIYNHFVNSSFFNHFDTYLCYVSVGSEVETINIIESLLSNGKRVGVPYCEGKTMHFYQIKSTDDLFCGSYGIPTANVETAEKIEDFSNTLCIVPALSFDKKGYRLGYGGGYYDRFLSSHTVSTLGLCYEYCIAESLPAESHDIKIRCVLTENGFRNIKEDTYE